MRAILTDILITVALAITATLLGFLLGAGLMREVMEEQAIERTYALYCPTDGKFAWVGECAP